VTKHFVIFGMNIALVTGSIALATTESPGDDEKSGAPTAIESTAADRPPGATLPDAHAPETTRTPISETNGQAPKAPLDPGNGNWDPPPVTAPTTQRTR
jgi:hypothetical protein